MLRKIAAAALLSLLALLAALTGRFWPVSALDTDDEE